MATNSVKTLTAAVALAASGLASAAMSDGNGGPSPLLLTGYAGEGPASYALNTGQTFETLLSGSFPTITFDLSGDSAYQSFLSGAGANPVVFGVAAAEQDLIGGTGNPNAQWGIVFSTNNTVTPSNSCGFSCTGSALSNFQSYVSDLNAPGKLDTSDSATFQPDDGGYYSSSFWGASFGSITPFNIEASLGESVPLYFLGMDLDESGQFKLDAFGNIVMETTQIGFATLTADSLEVTAVPVPAAVWLFGSALLGLVGMARRRA